MNIDVTGFIHSIQGQSLVIAITDEHPLIKLANQLPWESLVHCQADFDRYVVSWTNLGEAK
jgi:hypothetical protein